MTAYLVMSVFAFRLSVRFGVHESDYAWDMTDVVDVASLTFVSFVVAALWPLALIVGLLFAIVKRMFANAERNQ